ncbi:hypothetical protein ACFW6E_37700 [Streptomyces olivaceoviridis]|uniref:hypothetical protein n=1 Tax=Streptomyces olivaceoviridis TaxID=1921 RepID=UPI00369D1D5C
MNTSPDTQSYTSTVTADRGGAMTGEVGVITGDLTVRTPSPMTSTPPASPRSTRAPTSGAPSPEPRPGH